jgi:sec-independent protein translocase protein TatA
MGIGISELILILVVILLIFGGRKLPEIGRSLGQGLREFKKAMNELRESDAPSKKEGEGEAKKDSTEK